MIDYRKPAKPSDDVPADVRAALELYELWDGRVAAAKANNANPLRKAMKVPFYERADAARALAIATREWLNRNKG